MSDSDDDVPLAQRVHPASHHNDTDDEDDQPLANRQFTHKPVTNGNGAAAATHGAGASTAAPVSQTVADTNGWDSSSSDDVPLGKAQ